MPNLFLLFNHNFTSGQMESARNQLHFFELVLMPPYLKELWAQIPPDLPELFTYLAPLRHWLETAAEPKDFVLIQGDFGATFLMVQFALEIGLTPVYATSRREVSEEQWEDGTVKTVHHFRHSGFRRYGR